MEQPQNNKFWNQYSYKCDNLKESLKTLNQSLEEPLIRDQRIKQIQVLEYKEKKFQKRRTSN